MKTNGTIRAIAIAVLFGLGFALDSNVLAQSPTPGAAISLNGTNGYAQAPNGVWFSNNFTIEGWVYARSYNNWSRLLDFGNGTNNNNVYLALSAGTTGFPTMGVFTNTGVPILQSATKLPLYQWVHLAATLSNTTGTIYLDGVPIATGPITAPPSVVRTNNYLGRSFFGADGYANAEFDEIRIWNVARTQGQIQADMHRSLVGTETNLVGYWRMDEGAGTTLSDSSGHGQTAALLGGYTWTNSAAAIVTGAGSALNFTNNPGQLALIPHQAALNAYPLTIMCWFKAPPGTGGGALVNKYSSGSLNGYQLFMSGDGSLAGWYFRNGNSNIFNSGTMNAGQVNDGRWHHAAMVVDTAGGRLYLDGIQKSAIPWFGTPAAPTNTLPLSLGIYQGDSFWSGQLDDVSLWNTALSSNQITAAMNKSLAGTESGLLGYWRLDEGSGTNIVDATGHGYNGTLQGGTTWVSSGAAIAIPDPGYALNLNGVNQYARATNAVWFTNDFTVEGWVFARSYNNWSRLIDFGNGGDNHNIFLALSGGTGGFPVFGVYTNFGLPNISATNQLPLNQWAHLAATLNGTNGTIYINGNVVASGLITRPANVVRTNNYIGRSNYAADGYANAIFDELRIWNVARSQTQIQQAMKTPLTGREAGLLGYWRFDEGNGTNALDAAAGGKTTFLATGTATPTWILSSAPVTNLANNVTAPGVTNVSATNITLASAVLNGSVTPNGADTTAWFLYGMTTNYGSSTASINISSTNLAAAPVSLLVSNLSAGTLYHFTLVASNAAGTVASADATFTTVSLFNPVSAGLRNGFGQSAVWGDFNNDGALDLLQMPFVMSNRLNGTFGQVSDGLAAAFYGCQVWADFDNDGYLDVLVTGTQNGGDPVPATLLRNNGNGTFTVKNNTGLPNVFYSSITVGDYDNDGLQDVLITGYGGYGGGNNFGYSGIWHNNGNGTFTKIPIPGLPVAWNGSVASGDFDNDGYLDFVIAGVLYANPGGYYAQVWRNNGDGTFTQKPMPGLQEMYTASVAVADYDGDGFLDFAITGTTKFGAYITQLWKNNGSWNFAQETNAVLPGTMQGVVAWGDFDNNGYPDLALVGPTTTFQGSPSAPIAQLWQNTGGGTFANINANLPAWTYNSIAFGDYNNDGRLDFVQMGYNSGGQVDLEQNNTPVTNTPPTAPSGLQAVVDGSGAVLTWQAASDAQTPVTGLSYNIRVGGSSGGINIVSPMAHATTGRRRLPKLGNASEALKAALTNLHNGTYYWSVQTIDTAFAGSPFAAEGQFTITNGRPFAPLATTLAASSLTSTSATLNASIDAGGGLTGAWFEWGTTTDYGNATPAINAGNGLSNSVPVNFMIFGLIPGTTYHYRVGATNAGGSGFGGDIAFTTLPGAPTVSEPWSSSINPPSVATLNGLVQSGAADTLAWFEYGLTTNYGGVTAPAFFSGVNLDPLPTSALISNLTVLTAYHFRLVASNAYGVAIGPDVPFTTPSMAMVNAGLPNVQYYGGSATWGDFDNDDRLDVLTFNHVSRNNGDETFSEAGIGLPGFLGLGAQAWADFDNDGYLDLLITGNDGFTPGGAPTRTTQLWHNNGNGTFDFVPSTGLPSVDYGSIALGDFDNDGRQDIVLIGRDVWNPTHTVAGVWRNNGNGTFSPLSTPGFSGLMNGAVATGDFDSDGYLDFIANGMEPENMNHTSTRLWHNNGDGSFTVQNLPGVPDSLNTSISVGDYNNDGHPDFALSGLTSWPTTQVWSNNGNGTFSLDGQVAFTGVYNGATTWGDYDNDGKLDLLITGARSQDGGGGSNPTTEIWRNLGDGAFEKVYSSLPGMTFGGAAWGDFGNDGRLDILTAGSDGGLRVVLAKNYLPPTNTPPNAPAILQASVSSNGVVLNWNAGNDAQTPASGLSYNVRVGSAPGAWNIIAPQANTTNGFRRVAEMGNAEGRRMTILTNLPPGTYYWSVQSIDTSFAGSSFATESQFTISGPEPVTLPATQVTPNSAILNGTLNPNGSDTTAWFRWGATPALGSNTPPVLVLGTNVNPIALTATLSALSPGIPYYYQLVASNSIGVNYGAQLSFTTVLPVPPQIDHISLQPDRTLLLQFSGTAGFNYTLQTSTNLVDWASLTNLNADVNGLFQFNAGSIIDNPARFFRLRWP